MTGPVPTTPPRISGVARAAQAFMGVARHLHGSEMDTGDGIPPGTGSYLIPGK